MGIIRKTLSISTLGIVPFRSKKELLRRADRDRKAAEAQLEQERVARSEADRRVAAAEKRVQRAELTALHEAKRAVKARTRGRRGRKGRKARRSAMERFGDLVEGAQPVVEEQVQAAGRRARKAAKASRHAAERAQREAKRGGRRARARMKDLERSIAPGVEAAASRAQTVSDDLIDLTGATASQLKAKAAEVKAKATEAVDARR